MPRPQRPYNVYRRKDTNTFQLSINPSSGITARVCQEWQRRSFQDLPQDLALFRNPKSKGAAETGAITLIEYLKKKQEEGSARQVHFEDITVGNWIEKFTVVETSPRAGINVSENQPYSPDTVENYRSYWENHVKEDPFTRLKIAEVEEEDVTEFMTRLSLKKLKDGRLCGGTRTFAGVIVFIRMTFRYYHKKNRRWINPFTDLKPPKLNNQKRDSLPEDEVVALFGQGVLRDTMELAICAAMFLAGLRRSEIFALRPDCLDWSAPKIIVREAWQCYDRKDRQLGPPKGKRTRFAPFDAVLQTAIKKLWQENGQHEFVFSFKDGTTPGPSWIAGRFKKWLARAGINAEGRRIVPHSARHSLASILEERGVSLRYIQDLLGHSDLQTTKIYLHSTEKTIRDIGSKIDAVMEGPAPVVSQGGIQIQRAG